VPPSQPAWLLDTECEPALRLRGPVMQRLDAAELVSAAGWPGIVTRVCRVWDKRAVSPRSRGRPPGRGRRRQPGSRLNMRHASSAGPGDRSAPVGQDAEECWFEEPPLATGDRGQPGKSTGPTAGLDLELMDPGDDDELMFLNKALHDDCHDAPGRDHDLAEATYEIATRSAAAALTCPSGERTFNANVSLCHVVSSAWQRESLHPPRAAPNSCARLVGPGRCLTRTRNSPAKSLVRVRPPTDAGLGRNRRPVGALRIAWSFPAPGPANHLSGTTPAVPGGRGQQGSVAATACTALPPAAALRLGSGG
jgi:hypothetical protein